MPGLDVLHGIVDQVIRDAVPENGRVLVVGAGGGLELKFLAQRHPGWRFDGVDPSAAMLDLARSTLGDLADRARLHDGTTDAAPDGPFDSATCLLTMHFLPRQQRLATLGEIARRLRPGAPLVVCHLSVPGGDRRGPALERFARHANPDPAGAAATARTLAAELPILTPEEDEALLREAGFGDAELVWAALALRGWLAHRLH